jgi:membrane glycosyltransferase
VFFFSLTLDINEPNELAQQQQQQQWSATLIYGPSSSPNVDTPEIMTARNKRSTSKKAAAARRKAAANKDQVPEEANTQELLKRLAEQQTMIEQLTHIQAAEDRRSKPLSDDEAELTLPPCIEATRMIPVDVAD